MDAETPSARGEVPVSVVGTVVEGHGVASGRKEDPRFPGGTIAMQIPHFATRGLDLTGWYPGTINVSTGARSVEILRAEFTFREVAWHPVEPAEDFSFVACSVSVDGGHPVEGFLYHPHPETKPEHFQEPGVLEILLNERLDGVRSGVTVRLWFREGAVRIEKTGNSRAADPRFPT